MDEDKQLRDLLSAFNPQPATSTDLFISRLERNMDAVEAVKRHGEAVRRRNRLAVVAGAAAGFAAGVVCSRLMPFIAGIMPSIDLSALDIPFPDRADFSIMAAWILTAIACGLTALTTYEAVMTGLAPQQNHSNFNHKGFKGFKDIKDIRVRGQMANKTTIATRKFSEW